MVVWSAIIVLCVPLFGILIGGMIFLYKKMFNVRVVIYEQTAGGIKVYQRNAKRKESLEGNRLVFAGAKKESIPVPTGDYFFLMNKNKYLLNMYKDKAGNYKPIPLRWSEDINPLFVPDDNDMRFWKTVMDKETEETYKKDSWMNKYGGLMALGIIAIVCLIILIVYGQMYFKGIKEVAQPLSGQMGGLTNTLNNLVGKPPV
jgi:hypothetical protein